MNLKPFKHLRGAQAKVLGMSPNTVKANELIRSEVARTFQDDLVERAVESLVSGCVPHQGRMAAAFTALVDMLAGREVKSDESAKHKAKTQGSNANEREVSMRNYVARKLDKIYGREGAVRFCETYLDSRRWTELKHVCFRSP